MTMSRRMHRRALLQGAAGFAVGTAFHARAAEPPTTVILPFANGERTLVTFPEKRPLIAHTLRPINLETPFEVFDSGTITPNDAFFVRYATEPLPSVDLAAWRLDVKGAVTTPLSLTLAELKALGTVELTAVNQCSGNGRGFAAPRVGGGQSGNGVMGNATWAGIPLKTVLEKAGLAAGAVDVAFDGLDRSAWGESPDFQKSLPVDHANDGEVMLAWSMNGEDLPLLNGYPLRLVVPGHYGTYWVKHLARITVLDAAFEGYYMKKTYRIPDNECACVEPGTKPAKTRSIGRMNVRSFLTSHANGATVKANREIRVRGIAFDGGHGIREVLFSDDGGTSWRAGRLGADGGRYSFREWTASMTLTTTGEERDLLVRAVNRIGQSQPLEPPWNPSGYMRNVVERVRVRVA